MSNPLRVIVWPGMPDVAGLRLAAESIGREVELETVSSNEDIEALLDREGPWDLVTPSDYLVEKLAAAGRLAELDPDGRLDRGALDGWVRHPVYDPEERYSWPLAFGTTGYLYDSAVVDGPVRWDDFFRPEPGVRVGLLSEVREVIGAALLALGLPPDSTDTESLAAARELLDRQRPAVSSVTSDDFTSPIEAGQVAMHHAWSGPAAMAVRRTRGLGYVVPEEGALLWVTTAAIPADAPDPAGARRLLAALTVPEIAKLAVENGGYSTPNLRARDLLPADLREDPVLFPSSAVIGRCQAVRPLTPEGERAMLAAWP